MILSTGGGGAAWPGKGARVTGEGFVVGGTCGRGRAWW